jgi:sensor histidine kinase YesM
MLVQPFVENAIKHGVMHLEGKQGHIHISFRKEGELLLCTVADNGIGRERSRQINESKRKNHTSSGIEITLNRLRLAHQEKGTAFFYKVEDKQNASGEPEGTTTHFSIPYIVSHEANSHHYR